MAAKADKLFVDPKLIAVYKQFRPIPPKILIDRIIDDLSEKITPPFGQAVDVGCGSGQSTSVLAPHFQKVLGIDVSEAQISLAVKEETKKNVEYKLGSCYEIPLPDSSTDLVTASAAVHWFNLPAFFKEVDRILKPGGMVALYVYTFSPFEPPYTEELQEHLDHIYDVETAGYWHENRKIYDDLYAGVEIPYDETVRDYSIFEDNVWPVSNVVGFVKSWSGYQSLMEANPDKASKAIDDFEKKMMKTLNATGPSTEVMVNFRWKYTLLTGKKNL